MPYMLDKQPRRATARVPRPGSFAAAPPTKAGGSRPISPPSLVVPSMGAMKIPTDATMNMTGTDAWTEEQAVKKLLALFPGTEVMYSPDATNTENDTERPHGGRP
jgi:hypothetical protein